MKSAALQDRRVWIAGGVVAAVLIVAASWLLLISPKFASTRSLQSEAADVQLQAQQLSDTVHKLAEQNKHFGALQSKLAAALRSLPADSGMPAFTREVSAAAAQSGVTVTNLSVGAVTPVVAAVVEPTDTTTTSSAASDGLSSTSTSSTPTLAPSAPPASAQFTIGVTMTTTGKLPAQTRFLDLIERGNRRVLVSASNVTAGGPVNSAPTGAAAGGTTGDTVDTSATMTTSLTLFSATMTPAQLASVQKLLHASS